ncbi:hypothetical protein PILCRDRAFT_11858 [Piloderma croceum F 1598]|uniref:Uncharacterized protein n=1 Tax=Piloderma croceum (strain F 1598) TaxID=765440 RepID=A0A0C3FCS8_PILCF|nr:hypothetical protein PILCRDRAFT_11858 [Piloderma croceum F 1598]
MVFRVAVWLGSEAGVAGVAVVIPNATASMGVVIYRCAAAFYGWVVTDGGWVYKDSEICFEVSLGSN